MEELSDVSYTTYIVFVLLLASYGKHNSDLPWNISQSHLTIPSAPKLSNLSQREAVEVLLVTALNTSSMPLVKKSYSPV